jgi:nucleotide-binding universal stress UspA family protein
MRQLTIQRILVALDMSADSHAALEAATRLASMLKAEIVGLFVEDQDLLHMAKMPYAQEIRSPVAAKRKVETAGMEQQLRSHGQSASYHASRKGLMCRGRSRWLGAT